MSSAISSERNVLGGELLACSYDPLTGMLTGAVDENGNPVRYVDPGNLSIMGGDAWKWLLVGPVQ